MAANGIAIKLNNVLFPPVLDFVLGDVNGSFVFDIEKVRQRKERKVALFINDYGW